MNKLMLQGIILLLVIAMSAAAAAAGERVYTLKDAYDAALGTNEFVKIAEEGVLQGGSKVDQAWTYLYPRVFAQGMYTRYDQRLPESGGFVVQPLDQFMAALVVNQPLYTGGRTMAALRTANKMQEASKLDLSTTTQEVLLGVTEVYYSVKKAEKMVEIGQRSLARIERHKKITEQEAATRKTKVNQSALLRANTIVSQARINLVRMVDGLKVARQRFSQVTGLPSDVVFAEPPLLPTPVESLAELKAIAMKDRNDYHKSMVSQEMAQEGIQIIKGGHSPQVVAEAAIRYLDSNPTMMSDATSFYGALKLQIPIFEGGLMKAEVSEARSKFRQAEFARESLRKSIESDVTSMYINLQTANAVLEAAKTQMEYANGTFDSIESLFSQGLVQSLNVIDAEQALSYAEREVMSDTYDQQLAIVRLQKSIGNPIK